MKIIKWLIKTVVSLAIVGYVALVVVEYIRFEQDKDMLVVTSNQEIDYDDGHVKVTNGIGYKKIIYDRTSIKGKKFGPFFIKVDEK